MLGEHTASGAAAVATIAKEIECLYLPKGPRSQFGVTGTCLRRGTYLTSGSRTCVGDAACTWHGRVPSGR
jgi:hypothetical protein